MLLEAANIIKFYLTNGKRLDILKGIALKVESKEFLTIVGPSGAGKSTLLHILGGLDKPSEGKVLLDGEDVYKMRDANRAKMRNEKIGFVFQFYHLLPEFNALENVLLPLMIRENNYGFTKEFAKKGEQYLELVGLKDRMTHKSNQLSGGEQQRVAIARALINEPKIIFCDEPTGNLDSQTGREIIDLLVGLNEKNHQTLVIVTHDESIAKRAHRSLYIKDGVVV